MPTGGKPIVFFNYSSVSSATAFELSLIIVGLFRTPTFTLHHVIVRYIVDPLMRRTGCFSPHADAKLRSFHHRTSELQNNAFSS